MNSSKFTKMPQTHAQLWKGGLALLCVVASLGMAPVGHSAEPINPLLQKFSITVDSTALVPPTSWQVPGVTPLIHTMDPISSEAFATTIVRAVSLNPGTYRFGTFTFDFPFIVSREGLLQFDPSLDQCVKGRETRTLTVLCSHTQPYPQQPDY
ncbi:MAG: hypothetical protein OEW33_16475 [Nitrospirota bacterium]|nr:hypothetical protein [Nitrospirota bacterium]